MLRSLPFMFAAWLMTLAVAPFVPVVVLVALGLAAAATLGTLAFMSELRFLRAWNASRPNPAPGGLVFRYRLQRHQRRRLRRQRHTDPQLERLRHRANDWSNRLAAFMLGLVLAGAAWILLRL
jgi:hypothetical protein